MAAEILIVVPVLGRPARAQDVADAAAATDVPYRLLFVASRGDEAQIEASYATGADVLVAPWEAGHADFAKKANLALVRSAEPWIFVVGDDSCFCPGWATAALDVAKSKGVGVVGTNDRANPRVIRGETATHNLVARWYAERHGTVERSPAIFHIGYDHNFVDDELVETAKARDAWAFAERSWVPHSHPYFATAQWDLTYEKGHRHSADDKALFESRRHLWSSLDVARPPR